MDNIQRIGYIWIYSLFGLVVLMLLGAKAGIFNRPKRSRLITPLKQGLQKATLNGSPIKAHFDKVLQTLYIDDVLVGDGCVDSAVSTRIAPGGLAPQTAILERDISGSTGFTTVGHTGYTGSIGHTGYTGSMYATAMAHIPYATTKAPSSLSESHCWFDPKTFAKRSQYGWTCSSHGITLDVDQCCSGAKPSTKSIFERYKEIWTREVNAHPTGHISHHNIISHNSPPGHGIYMEPPVITNV